MTAQEKAKELVGKFGGVGLQQRNEAVACALICVNEIILHCNEYEWLYWKEVKKEIELL